MQYDTKDISIRLRALEPEDLDLLYSVENNTEEWAIGSTSMPYSRDILRQYIMSTTGDIFADKQVRLIIETADNKTAGLIDLTSFDPKNQHAEVGITVLPAFRNSGIATLAMQLLEQYASQTVHIHMLYAIVPEDNICSLKLFEKCGFSTSGALKEWLFDGKKYRNARVMQKII